MLRYLLGFRANVAIIFFGAFATMALIKLTAYLPGKYYFSFSKLFAGASEPFIIDPPSVTGAKLCALMSKHNLSADDIGRQIDCSARTEHAGSTSLYGAALFEKAEIDKIYSTALTSDRNFRAGLAARGLQLMPPAIPNADLDQILASAGSVSDAFRRIWSNYETAISGLVEQTASDSVNATFAEINARESGPTIAEPPGSGPKLKGLSAEQLNAIREAHAAFLSKLANENLGNSAEPLTKTAVDTIINTAYGKESIPNGVMSHYRDAILQHAKSILQSKFAEAGVPPVEKEAAKRIIFEELVKDGLGNYLVASVIRLSPVLLLGAVLGFLFGRGELFSVSFSGALTAFLLTWPIMLMWDRVVQSTWHDKKLIFIAFYVVYIISFFLTARVGALIGVRMREGAPEQLKTTFDRETGALATTGTSWAEIAGNVFLGLLANGAVAAWNVVIPLGAS